jgi:general secretion pathway protein L
VKDFITENTMAFAFENKIQHWRGRLQSGPAGKFVRWWLGELRQLMPPQWQEKLQHALRRVTLGIENGDIHLSVEENHNIQALEIYSTDQEVPLQRQQISDLLVEQELLEVPRFYLLDSAKVLRKELLLPEATEANLAQVLTFEMDRQTPFSAADVYFGWRVLAHNRDTHQIKIEIFVTQRKGVDDACNLLAGRGLAPGGVDIVENGRTLGLNLLPPDKRVRVVNRRVRLNYALAGMVAILLIAVMAQSLLLRSHQVGELEEAIALVRDEARLVQRIKDQIRDTSEAAGFLTQRRRTAPLAVEILADVTAILPDDTHLDRLVFGQSTVQLQGKSQNAQQLIERVNDSDLLQDAAFRGSTRLDARSGLEVFEVNATVTGRNVNQEGES